MTDTNVNTNEGKPSYRKQRNEIINDLGLRPITARKWVDEATAKICAEMLEEMRGRGPSLGVSFFLREPMLKDPSYLVASWESHRGSPTLFRRVETAAEALHLMQQEWRRALCAEWATPWSELHGDDERYLYETRSAAVEGFI